MISAVIFDFDGVLVESAELKTRAFASLFKSFPDHLDEILAYHHQYVGISRYRKFKHFHEAILGIPYTEEIGMQLGAEFSKLVVDQIIAGPCVSGAREFLEKHYVNLPLYVASGTPQSELEEIADAKLLSQYFRAMFGSPIPKYEATSKVLEHEHLSPQEVVFVGDGLSDQIAAEEAGTHFILRRTQENLDLAREAELVIDDLTSLSTAIQGLSE